MSAATDGRESPADADPISLLRRSLDAGEPSQRLGASNYFSVDDRERSWLVVRGSVDLFVTIGDRRHHLLRAEAGDVVLGIDNRHADVAVTAVPGNGAELLPTSCAKLLSLLSESDTAGTAIQRALERWVNNATAIDHERFDRASAPLAASTRVHLDAGMSVRPVGEPLCIDLPLDALAFPDDTSADFHRGGHVCIPLRQTFWFKTTRAIDVCPITLGDWLRRPQLATDLDDLHALVLEAARRAIARREGETLRHIDEQSSLAETRLGEALRLLAGVNQRRQRYPAHLGRAPIVAAAALVLEANGIPLTLSRDAERSIQVAADPAFALASDLGLLYRRVRLSGTWWTRNSGTFLCFFREDRRPCAVLQRSPTSYWLVDPQHGERRVVTRELANALQSEGYTFVTPLPQGPIGGVALLRFGSIGLSRDIGWLVTAIVLVGLLSLVTPVVTGFIIDPVIPFAQLDQRGVLSIALIIAGFSSFAFTLIQSFAVLRLQSAMNHRIAAAIWDRLLRLPTGFFRDYSTGDLASRALGIDQIRELFSVTVIASMMHSTSGLMSLGLMFYYSWQLAVVATTVAAIYIGISLEIGRRASRHNRSIAAQSGRLQGFVVQLLGAVPRLRISASEKAAFVQWAERYAALMRTTYRRLRLNGVQTVAQSAFGYLTTLAIFMTVGLASGRLFAPLQTPTDWEAITSIISLIMPAAVFVPFNTALGQFNAAVFGLAQTCVQVLNLGPLYERAAPILTAEPEWRGVTAEPPGDIVGRVEVRDVHFRYSAATPPALRGLTLMAEPGQLVGIVGPSGAGKSSLVRLLLGFEEPERGSIFVDGKDLRNLNKRALRQQYGVVLQDGRILSGSMFHNITAGAYVTREDAWEAARIAGLARDIEAMPMGMDTFLNEGATVLSGGQRQRVMIARAVVRRPKVLIFDEATSALDNETQTIVTRNLETLSCTRIVIAHRLSSISNADVIYVVDAGRVVEQGTFAQLVH